MLEHTQLEVPNLLWGGGGGGGALAERYQTLLIGTGTCVLAIKFSIKRELENINQKSAKNLCFPKKKLTSNCCGFSGGVSYFYFRKFWCL